MSVGYSISHHDDECETIDDLRLELNSESRAHETRMLANILSVSLQRRSKRTVIFGHHTHLPIATTRFLEVRLVNATKLYWHV